MIDKLKACFYILLAKQYVVFTADRVNAHSKRTYAEKTKRFSRLLFSISETWQNGIGTRVMKF